MRSATKTAIVLASIAILTIPLLLLAGTTGKIKGIVVDKNTGDPIPGVSIQIIGTTLGAMSDPDGKFIIYLVPEGVVDIRVTSVGYKTQEITSLKVNADGTAEVKIELEAATEELDVVIKATSDRDKIDIYKVSSEVTMQRDAVVYQSMNHEYTNTPSAPSVERRKARGANLHSYCTPPPAHGGTSIVNGEAFDAMFFKNYGVNPFVDTEDDHLSTFAIDVDDASFVMARSYFNRGELPPNEAIRAEEFINHFDYDYQAPHNSPFAIFVEAAPSKFGQNCQLLQIGIKGREINPRFRKPANLVFVIDVSGSMKSGNRLGLVKKSLRFLVEQLNPQDQVGIVVYGSRGQVILNPSSVEYRRDIMNAIDRLVSGGSTNAEEGIRLGYEMADRMFDPNMTNRVILCSDGVANVGRTGPDEILKQIKRYAEKGITLSAIGFGMGNYNDILMEKLGNKGNGHYAYVDDITEARRIFVDNLTGMLEVIARDVKIQVDFDPNVVRSYRLIGYENRDVADNKFRDDKEDGGEIGAGHDVTALYEIKFHKHARGNNVGTVYVRYKAPDEMNRADEIQFSLDKSDFRQTFEESTPNLKLAAAVAEFAEVLRKSYWAKDSDLDDILDLALEAYNAKQTPEVLEFMNMVSKAKRFEEQLAER